MTGAMKDDGAITVPGRAGSGRGRGRGLHRHAQMAGRPFVSDTVGRVLVALVIAGVALMLLGGGWLWN